MRREIAMFLAISVLGGVVTASSDAAAGWRRFNAASCFDENYYDDSGANLEKLRFAAAAGVYNADSQTHWLACPVEEDSHLWLDSITSLQVNVNASNYTANGVSAKACVLYDQAVGGACGTTHSSSGAVGPLVLTPGVSVWNQTWFGETYAGDFAYVSVGLSWVPSGSTFNSIRGYSIGN